MEAGYAGLYGAAGRWEGAGVRGVELKESARVEA